MISITESSSDKMRIIDYHCRISLGEFLGRELFHESARVNYILTGRGKSQPNYFAEWDKARQNWVLFDSFNRRCGEFAAKSVMTRWVRKRAASQS